MTNVIDTTDREFTDGEMLRKDGAGSDVLGIVATARNATAEALRFVSDQELNAIAERNEKLAAEAAMVSIHGMRASASRGVR